MSPRDDVNAGDTESIEQQLLKAESAEELKARLEREHGELLQELRALIPGATVLFGFLLAPTPAALDVCVATDPDPAYSIDVASVGGWSFTASGGCR